MRLSLDRGGRTPGHSSLILPARAGGLKKKSCCCSFKSLPVVLFVAETGFLWRGRRYVDCFLKTGLDLTASLLRYIFILFFLYMWFSFFYFRSKRTISCRSFVSLCLSLVVWGSHYDGTNQPIALKACCPCFRVNWLVVRTNWTLSSKLQGPIEL
jgi:hypothetical protein